MPKWGTQKIVVNGKECEAVEKTSTNDLYSDQIRKISEFDIKRFLKVPELDINRLK